MERSKAIKIFCVIAVLVFLAIILFVNIIDNSQLTSESKAIAQIEKMVKKMEKTKSVVNVQATPDTTGVTYTSLKEELPEISKFPYTVEGKTKLNIEIFSSTEKSGAGTDGWLNEIATKFNKENYKINGQAVSVSVRSISSGVAADYIISGKYTPDAFTPSNELWGEMVKSKNIKIELKEEKITGNVTGIVMKKEKYNQFIQKYGEVTISNIINACSAGDISMAYTNPFASSTGLNFIIATLADSDPTDLLSSKAISEFEKFQATSPLMAYTTIQMRDAVVSKSSQDAMVLEYQTFQNTQELQGYEFIPFGVRHDSPMYAIGELSDDRNQLLDKFIEYCKSQSSQQLATQYGFNGLDSYTSTVPEVTGDTIVKAQELWKEKKNINTKIAAVFVADISGSMDGLPINNLKKSLINSAQYINQENLIGLVSYNSKTYINLPIATFDLTQQQLFTGSIKGLSAGGNTATFDAVIVATNMLIKAKESDPTVKPMIFILSDGETNSGHSLDNTLTKVIEGVGIPIYTIGYNANLSELQKISSINEAASINADSDDVIYSLKNLFNAQM